MAINLFFLVFNPNWVKSVISSIFNSFSILKSKGHTCSYLFLIILSLVNLIKLLAKQTLSRANWYLLVVVVDIIPEVKLLFVIVITS